MAGSGREPDSDPISRLPQWPKEAREAIDWEGKPEPKRSFRWWALAAVAGGTLGMCVGAYRSFEHFGLGNNGPAFVYIGVTAVIGAAIGAGLGALGDAYVSERTARRRHWND
jgi:hypothetical protein